ncbi:MFS transporter, partial [Microbacterium sp. CPCC 204701]|uniref:MFS transporter n=1 Tax=Microbacterium sp. CPCC 204701 TaxID=2493084 RepID=UPI000FD8F037
ADGYLLLAGVVAIGGTLTAVLLPDPQPLAPTPPTRTARPRRAARLAVLRDRDFAFMLWGRLAVNIGNALGTGLLLFFLLYGLDQETAAAEEGLLLLIVVYTVFVVAVSIVGGRYSDRTGRRRGLIVGSGLVQAAAAVLIAIAPTFEVTMVAAALLGVGYGAFSTVGLALATDLLPNEDDHARDLGLVTVSTNLGQLLGPLVGAGLVALVGGFWLLFAASAVISAVGALMYLAVRTPVRAS